MDLRAADDASVADASAAPDLQSACPATGPAGLCNGQTCGAGCQCIPQLICGDASCTEIANCDCAPRNPLAYAECCGNIYCVPMTMYFFGNFECGERNGQPNCGFRF
jgi:hypothetical protein